MSRTSRVRPPEHRAYPDILLPMARERLVQVFVSVNSLDNHLAAKLEPRASAPHRRIKAICTLAEAGVPVGVLVAPIIPALNDRDMEAVMAQAADAGARSPATPRCACRTN